MVEVEVLTDDSARPVTSRRIRRRDGGSMYKAMKEFQINQYQFRYA